MNTSSPLRAIVFDLDGTLIDSAPDLHAAINRLLREEGQPELDLARVTTMIGEGMPRLVGRAFAAVGIELAEPALARYTERFRELYAEAPMVHTRLYPGAVEILRKLHAKGLALGLCTNKPLRHTQLILEALGVAELFGAVLGGDSLKARKPAPEPLLATLEGLGTAPAAALYVGDSPTDHATAVAAGVPVVLVTFGYSRVDVRGLDALAHLDHLEDLAGLVTGRIQPGFTAPG